MKTNLLYLAGGVALALAAVYFIPSVKHAVAGTAVAAA